MLSACPIIERSRPTTRPSRLSFVPPPPCRSESRTCFVGFAFATSREHTSCSSLRAQCKFYAKGQSHAKFHRLLLKFHGKRDQNLLTSPDTSAVSCMSRLRKTARPPVAVKLFKQPLLTRPPPLVRHCSGRSDTAGFTQKGLAIHVTQAETL